MSFAMLTELKPTQLTSLNKRGRAASVLQKDCKEKSGAMPRSVAMFICGAVNLAEPHDAGLIATERLDADVAK